MTDAIVTERLTKHYGERRVVDSLDLSVPQGSVYGLLGRNGAGKSTAIKMIMGMVRPDSGRTLLLGEDSQNLPDATRARIAYLAEGHPLYGWMTIDDAVKFTRSFYTNWNDSLAGDLPGHTRCLPIFARKFRTSRAPSRNLSKHCRPLIHNR